MQIYSTNAIVPGQRQQTLRHIAAKVSEELVTRQARHPVKRGANCFTSGYAIFSSIRLLQYAVWKVRDAGRKNNQRTWCTFQLYDAGKVREPL